MTVFGELVVDDVQGVIQFGSVQLFVSSDIRVWEYQVYQGVV